MPPHIAKECDRFDLGNDVVSVDDCESSVDDQLKTSLSLTENNFGRQCSVVFAQFIEVVDIPHINDLSNEEIENTWMSREELHFFKMECLDTVVLMNAGETLNENDGLCERGLEKHTAGSLERIARVRCCAFEAVFGMQKFHRLKGFSLPNLMAELYSSSSAPSQSEAHQMGFQDAAAIESQ
jgi:hypothetical protein